MTVCGEKTPDGLPGSGDGGRFGNAAVRTAAVSLTLLAVALFAVPAPAQDLSAMTDRLERLERGLTDLQRTVYGGAPPPAASATGSGSAAAPTAMARVEIRLQRLEAQLRELTGRIEETQHLTERLQQRMDVLQSDTDLRLRSLEGGAPPDGTSGADPGGAGPGRSDGASSGAGTSPPRGTLGTLSGTDLQAAPATGALAGLPPPGADPEDLFNAAFDLLVQREFGDAERAFQRFVDDHPNDPLAGNAQYWLGETYYVRERFDDAAVAFLRGYQTYPESPKAPDNLLKLGMALARVGKIQEACVTLAKVEADFAQAGPQIKRRLFLEKQRLQCE